MALQVADFDHNLFSNRNAGDSKLAVRFFLKAKQDMDETQKEGRPIFKEVEYIHIMIPGDRKQTVVRPVAVADKTRFEKQYNHWKQTRQNDLVIGTPLEAWGILSLAQVEEFRYFGVRSIEQLADLRDDICGKLPQATQLKQKAQAFVAMLKEEAPMRKMQGELDKRDAQIEALTKAVEAQAEELKQFKAQNEAKTDRAKGKF